MSAVRATALGEDERKLAMMGYRQTFPRILGAFESFATGFNAIAFCSYINVVWSIAMFNGGPQAVIVNYLAIGFFALCTSLVLAEICSSMPASGSIFYWSAKLGGNKYGPFLSWLTAWLNFSGWLALTAASMQSFAVSVISVIQLYHPEFENTVQTQCLLALACTFACWMLNIMNEETIKYLLSGFAVVLLVEFAIIMVWLPVSTPKYQSVHSVFNTFYNFSGGSDGLAWCIGSLFAAFIFSGYEAAAHVAEETQQAATRAANSIWRTVLAVWIMGLAQVLVMLFCTPSFDDVVNSTSPIIATTLYLQTLGKRGTTLLLVLQCLTILSSSTVAVTFVSRVAYTIARDSVLPFPQLWTKMSSAKLPVNAVTLVCVLVGGLEVTVLGSTTAFTALISVSSVALNTSYIIPIIARLFVSSGTFVPGPFHLGRMVFWIGSVSILSTCFQIVVFCLPTLYPVTVSTMNYASVMLVGVCVLAIGGWFAGAKTWFHGPKSQFTVKELDEIKMEMKSEEYRALELQHQL